MLTYIQRLLTILQIIRIQFWIKKYSSIIKDCINFLWNFSIKVLVSMMKTSIRISNVRGRTFSRLKIFWPKCPQLQVKRGEEENHQQLSSFREGQSRGNNRERPKGFFDLTAATVMRPQEFRLFWPQPKLSAVRKLRPKEWIAAAREPCGGEKSHWKSLFRPKGTLSA